MIYHSSYLVGLAVGNFQIHQSWLLFIIYGRLTIRCASRGRDADPISHQVPVTTHWVLWPTEMWIWKEWDFDGHYWPYRDYWNFFRIVYQGLSNIISEQKQICKNSGVWLWPVNYERVVLKTSVFSQLHGRITRTGAGVCIFIIIYIIYIYTHIHLH